MDNTPTTSAPVNLAALSLAERDVAYKPATGRMLSIASAYAKNAAEAARLLVSGEHHPALALAAISKNLGACKGLFAAGRALRPGCPIFQSGKWIPRQIEAVEEALDFAAWEQRDRAESTRVGQGQDYKLERAPALLAACEELARRLDID